MLKPFQPFFAEWNGHYTNCGGGTLASGMAYQCVCLAKQWEEYQGWTPLTHGNAIKYWEDGESGYTKVENTPEGIPPVGALVIFEEGEYGHIAIAAPDCTVRNCVVFQQNAPEAGTTTHAGSPCNLETYNYEKPKCLGWLIKE